MRKKINEVYGRTLPEKDIRELATLVYYPSEKIELVKKEITDDSEMEDWYREMLHTQIEVCKST